MATQGQRWEKGGGRVGGNKERKGEMEVVILDVTTCSSIGCLAEMSFRLATDLPCQSASRCVYYAVVCHLGKTADRVQAPCLDVWLTSEFRTYKHYPSLVSTIFAVIFFFLVEIK